MIDWEDPLHRAVVKILGVAALVMFAVWFLFARGGDEPTASPKPAEVVVAGKTREPSSRERELRRALDSGVERAAKLGGAVEAAVMVRGSARPLVVASEPGAIDRRSRMWSMSKVPTMAAVLRSLGWGDKPGKRISRELAAAFQAALTRSENCPQRRMVLALQEQKGSPKAAIESFRRLMEQAGARPRVGSAVQAPDSRCIPFLKRLKEPANPLARGALFGTSEQSVTDAVRFMDALGNGAYGAAVAERVLGLMRAPKRPSRETPAGDYTADLNWGAGSALRSFDPAYKAGWGGSKNGNFMAAQVAFLKLPRGGSASVAVVFHPAAQPMKDDPGLTAAPKAIERVMAALRPALKG